MSEQELEAVGEDYYLFLGDLTTNSRPIISNLTQLAQENVNAAPYITKAIEKRIEKATPNQKLYAFYLLDSICKNTGSPYTLLFGHNLFKTFTQAYLLVDDAIRKKFIDLFKTWKSATNSSGLPLFPNEPVEKIEQFLIRAGALYQNIRNSGPNAVPSPPISNNNITSASLIPIVDKLHYLTNQRHLATPHDVKISEKLQIINSLKYAIQTQTLPPQTIQQIKFQLDEMTRQEENILRSLTPTPPAQTQKEPLNPASLPNLNGFLAKLKNNVNDQASSSPTPTPVPAQLPAVPPVQSTSPVSVPQVASTVPQQKPVINTNALNNLLNLKTAIPTVPQPKTDLSALFSKLEQKGLVKPVNKTPSIPSASALKSLLSLKPQTNITGASKVDNESEAVRLLASFTITSKFLSIDPTTQYKFFFETSRPNKCGTCGKRFENTPKGLEKRREHLDWHFRINKKLKEGSIVQSRSWYLDDESFVNFRDDEIFSSIKDENNEDTESKNEIKTKKNNYVIVPADSTDMRVVCGICKEVMNGEYDDDLGEWVFQNAIEANGKIFHEVCFNESGMLEKLILKRDRNDEKKVDLNLLKGIVGNLKVQQ